MAEESPAQRFGEIVRWCFGPPAPGGTAGHLWPRWIFLRCLGLWFFSAFYSLWFQAHGLIGPDGILPAGPYLDSVRKALGWKDFWYAPTVFWLSASRGAITSVLIAGGVASLLLIFNVWPRMMVLISELASLSFISTLQDFSSYQSDGMLLSAGFVSLFFTPRGIRPGLGADHPPSRASLFALQWLWFCIYFESGVVKILSGDPEWRRLTAMDHYYENGPLPTWIGWYAQQTLSHAFHAATAFATLALELVGCWLLFFPRRFKIGLFFVVTVLQVGIILTSNYAFLNYLVLSLGFLLLDDRFLARLGLRVSEASPVDAARWQLAGSALALGTYFYVTLDLMSFGLMRFLPQWPVEVLEPFRIANRYGLFAVMTTARYEIEFQGSADGRTWTPYLFPYKPQDPKEPPGIYAPYQPRFEWNLWFASLEDWRQASWVVQAEARLLEGSRDVLRLFRGDPFHGQPPTWIRAVKWQYWFTTPEQKRETGAYWRREEQGLFAPALHRRSDGRLELLQN